MMQKISTVNIPKAIDLVALVQPMSTDAEEVQNYVGKLAVKTNDDLHMSTKFLAEIKSQSKEIDDKRKSFVNPMKELVKEIDAFFKPPIEALKEAESIVKNKVAECVEARLDKRDALLEKVSSAETQKRSTLIAKADDLLPPKIAGLSFRENYVGELVAPSEVVQWAIDNNKRELLQVNEKALKNFTNAIEEDPKIPGWVVHKNRTVVITPSKVK